MSANAPAAPNLPTLSSSAEGSRLSNELRRFIDLLLRAGLFLTRNNPGRVLVPAAGYPPSLSWDCVNRIVLTADGVVHLPRVAPRYVGVPLYLMKLTPTGILTLRPTGLGLDRQTACKINSFTDEAISSARLYVLMNDGLHWFMSN